MGDKKIKFELRGRCPVCKTERTIFGVVVHDPTPAAMDAAENRMPDKMDAHCPTCDAVEDIAFFCNDKQREPWLNADEYERRNGPNAGPLPPKPWEKPE